MGEEVEVLQDLGLTSTQARVYLALCKFGMLDTKQIAKCALMSRQDVYRILQNLENLGLVEKTISRPVRYKAVPADKGLPPLLKRKKKEAVKLEIDFQVLLKNFKKNSRAQLHEAHFQTIIVPGKKALLLKIEKIIGEAQDSLCTLGSFRRVSKALFGFSDGLKLAMDRGVKLYIVTEKGKDEQLMPNTLREYYTGKERLLDIKYVMNQLPTHILVVDRKQVLISTSTKNGFAESPALWSNNPCIVALTQDHFDILWLTAPREPNLQINGMST